MWLTTWEVLVHLQTVTASNLTCDSFFLLSLSNWPEEPELWGGRGGGELGRTLPLFLLSGADIAFCLSVLVAFVSVFCNASGLQFASIPTSYTTVLLLLKLEGLVGGSPFSEQMSVASADNLLRYIKQVTMRDTRLVEQHRWYFQSSWMRCCVIGGVVKNLSQLANKSN